MTHSVRPTSGDERQRRAIVRSDCMLHSPAESSLAVATQRRAPWRLGIINGSVGALDPQGRVAVHPALGRLLEALRERVPTARVCMPILPERQDNMTHLLNYPGDAIVRLPPLATTISAQRYYLQTRRTVRAFAAENDVLFIRLPFQLPLCLRGLGKPKVLQVLGNLVEVVRASSDYRGPAKILARWFARHSSQSIRRLVAEPQTRTVTHGQEVWQLLGCRHGRTVVSSCIFKAEMRPREDLRLGEPPRLLFVGYLRPEKGVETLLEAFGLLRQKRELKLTLVGGIDRRTGAGERIWQRISESPFRDDIRTTGAMDFGESLFDLYRSHDLFVLPSLSEGTPRTLVEARSFGCPVVATRVGGIPSSVEHGVDGLLVDPNDPAGLAVAIEQILDDEPLRLRLIRAGIDRSQTRTLEAFAADLVDELEIVARESGHERQETPG
jgi:glycosyltransferase involved in cell wall biosynthesis